MPGYCSFQVHCFGNYCQITNVKNFSIRFNHIICSNCAAGKMLGYLGRRALSSGFRQLKSYSRNVQLLHSVRNHTTDRAQILSGTAVSLDIRNALKAEIRDIRQNDDPSFMPSLAIVQVGDREDSNVYIRMKCKNADDIGMKADHIKLSSSTTERELLEVLDSLNNDHSVHGIIVQLPLDCRTEMDTHKVTNAIIAHKDVDGLGEENAGRLSHGDMRRCIIPCTPKGCLELIDRTGVQIEGKKAVVLGRSKIVGGPMRDLLIARNATVTTCHSRTKDIAAECRRADILVVGIGQPQFVKKDWVKPGAVVIDCGINSIPTTKGGKRLVGDVDYEGVSQVASWITPVPGGVGPMTVTMLLKNTVEGAKKCSPYVSYQKKTFQFSSGAGYGS